MSIIATGSKTIIDLSDGKSLSVYLGSNQPRMQVNDVNAGTYSPDWTTQQGKLVITPVVYANQTAIELTNTALSITWKRREGSGNEANLTTNETVTGNVLTVNANKMASITSKLLTYIANVTYTDPDTTIPINAAAEVSFAMVTTGENAKSAWISGEQVFKYESAEVTPSPAQITLTANLQNVTMSKWQYKNSSGTWTDYPTTSDNASITGTTLVVKPTHSIFVGQTASIRIITSDADIVDMTSIYKVTDGASGAAGADGADGTDGTDGVSASIAFLTNESITFAGNVNGQVAATTVTCNVAAYTGAEKVTPTVGTVTGSVSGMTVTKGSASNNEIPISIAITANSTLGGAGTQSGTLLIPITSPVSTTLQIHWSKVNTGATGAAGAHAVVMSVYAPGGTVFQNGSGTLTLQASAYEGASQISSGATYAWAKYASGNWTPISGQTSSSLSVAGSDVAGVATYRCTMTYKSSNYQDVITLTDKTDNYQAVIDSTAGDVFKNTVGTTYLVCRIWQNGSEVDTQKSATFSETAPTSPTTGQFYYKGVSGTIPAALMRYSGSEWVDVSNNASYKHTKTYTWYRRDKDGNVMDDGEAFGSGKVIRVTGSDVDVKTVFTCEVE